MREETCAALVRDERPADVVDEAMGAPVRWGLGLMPDTFGFGRYCSPRTFGHTGASACLVRSDPDAGPTIAAHFDGNASLADRIRRDHALCPAVSTDLGLSTPQDGGATTWPVLGRSRGAPAAAGRAGGPPGRRRAMVRRWVEKCPTRVFRRADGA